YLQRCGVERLRIQPLRLAGREVRMVVPYRIGLLVGGAARYHPRRGHRYLCRGCGAPRIAAGHGAMMFRVESQAGEWIDRAAPLRFSFEGREYRGYAGDTISSALAAAGVPYLARSFKYHRPRSILSFANHDSNVLFQVDGLPNVRGDLTLLRDGMRVSAINTFGGLWRDRARVLDRCARLLPVGFYL